METLEHRRFAEFCDACGGMRSGCQALSGERERWVPPWHTPPIQQNAGIFQSPKRGRTNSALSESGICPWVASEGGTKKSNARADANPQAMPTFPVHGRNRLASSTRLLFVSRWANSRAINFKQRKLPTNRPRPGIRRIYRAYDSGGNRTSHSPPLCCQRD